MAQSPDPIALAVAAADKPEARSGGQMQLSTGRVIAINVPSDLTDAEFLEAIVILIAQVRGSIRQSQANAARGRILVPGNLRFE